MSDENNDGTPPTTDGVDWLRQMADGSAPVPPASTPSAPVAPPQAAPSQAAPSQYAAQGAGWPSATQPSAQPAPGVPSAAQPAAWSSAPPPAMPTPPAYQPQSAAAPPAQPPQAQPPVYQPPMNQPPSAASAPQAPGWGSPQPVPAAPPTWGSAAEPPTWGSTPAPSASAPAAPAASTPAPPVAQPSAPPAAVPSAPQPAWNSTPSASEPAAAQPLLPRPSFMSTPLVEPSAPQPTTQYPVSGQYNAPSAFQPSSVASAPAPLPPTAQYPAQQAPSPASTPTLAYASAAPTVADAAPAAFGAGSGFNGFKLERHASENPPNNSPIDWASLVLAIVLPPIGLITAIVALALGFRNRGFGSTVAKVAVPIAVVMTVVAGAGGAVYAKTAADNAAHASLVASSTQWCSQVKSGPGGYTSATFGWPSPADTVAASITAMQGYVTRWTALQKIAPKGIATGSGELVAMAKSIVSTDTSTQTVDDVSNVSQMQDSAANSGIPQWIASYCE